MTDTIDEGVAASESPDESATPGPALDQEQLVVLAPDVLADSLGDYFKAWWIRIRSGETGKVAIG